MVENTSILNKNHMLVNFKKSLFPQRSQKVKHVGIVL